MNKAKLLRVSGQLKWYVFILPTLVCLLVLTYVPTLQAFKYSTYEVSVIGFNEKFVGLNNFRTILTNTGFKTAIYNTLYLIVLSLFNIPIGFILASVINGLPGEKTQTLFRSGFYLPNIMTSVSIVLIFQYILQIDKGFLNTVISYIAGRHIEIAWLSSPRLAKIGASIISMWSAMGYNMLICLASLQGIGPEIYEAALVDGAGGVKSWIHITIPLMRSTFVFLFITTIIHGFNRFTDLFVLSLNSAAGRPGGSLQTILMYIFQYSFENPAYGIACAGSIILFAIVLTITCINLKVTKFI
ncbi:lactose ABC transporter permease [Spirochaetia bacterium]|nr:lactose ABC transporter permease [Spirochaetia bacterium]